MTADARRVRLCLDDHCGLTHDSTLPISLDSCPYCRGADLVTLWTDETPDEQMIARAVAIPARRGLRVVGER